MNTKALDGETSMRAALADVITQNSERTAGLASIQAPWAATERIESEKRFRQLVEGAPEGIYINTGLRFRYLNPAALSLFGADSQEQMVGQSVRDRHHPF